MIPKLIHGMTSGLLTERGSFLENQGSFLNNLYLYPRGNNFIASSEKGIFLDFLLSVGTILRVESIEII